MAKKMKIQKYTWLIVAAIVVLAIIVMSSGESGVLAKYYAPAKTMLKPVPSIPTPPSPSITEVLMFVDDVTAVAGHTVKLVNVGSAPRTVVVSVDGIQETVTGLETVGPLTIQVKDTFYSSIKSERSATLLIEHIVATTETFGLKAGESIPFAGHTVVLDNVASSGNTAVFTIGSVQETVTGCETVNAVKICVKDTAYHDTKSLRYAIFEATV